MSDFLGYDEPATSVPAGYWDAPPPATGTDFFGQDYNVATAIDPNIPSFSTGGGGAVDFGGMGGEPLAGGYTPPAQDYSNLPGIGGVDLSYLSGGDGGALPPGATLSEGSIPGFTSTEGSSESPRFNYDAIFNATPAGTTGAPNVEALNDSPLGAGQDSPIGTTLGAPGGVSAAGGGAVGGSPDLSSGGDGPQWDAALGQYSLGGLGTTTDTTPQDKGLPGVGSGTASTSGGEKSPVSDSWKSVLGNNPVGTAIAGGGLLASMLNAKKTTPNQAALEDIARANNATGQQLTTAGKDFATQGNADLRTRAASTDPNATTLMDRGTGLTGYVGTGTLPASIQTQLDQAKADARVALISRYASRGMPTDPARNSTLAAELADLDRRTIAQGEALAAELAKTGTGLVTSGSGLNTISGGFENNAAQLGTNLVNSGVSASGLAGNTFTTLDKIEQARNEQTQKAIAAMAAALSSTSVKPKITIG